LPPKLPCDLDGVDTSGLPPFLFIACTVDGSMVGAAQRYDEFIAGLPAKCPRLQMAKVMRVRGLAAADKACLLGDQA
jgi:hypothetical protein